MWVNCCICVFVEEGRGKRPMIEVFTVLLSLLFAEKQIDWKLKPGIVCKKVNFQEKRSDYLKVEQLYDKCFLWWVKTKQIGKEWCADD